MRLIEDRWGNKNALVWFDSREEEDASCEAFLKGEYGKLTAEEIRMWQDAVDDPDGSKFEAAHAGEIWCSKDWLDEMMFVNMPTEWSMEKCLGIIKRHVGPHPLDYTNVIQAVNEIMAAEYKRQGYEVPLSKRAIELLSSNPHWRAQHPEYCERKRLTPPQ